MAKVDDLETKIINTEISDNCMKDVLSNVFETEEIRNISKHDIDDRIHLLCLRYMEILYISKINSPNPYEDMTDEQEEDQI